MTRINDRDIRIKLVHREKPSYGGLKSEVIDVVIGGWPVSEKTLCSFEYNPDKIPYAMALEEAFDLFTEKLARSLR